MRIKRQIIILNILKLFTALSYVFMITNLDYIAVYMWVFLFLLLMSGILGIISALFSIIAILILLMSTLIPYSKTTVYFSILSIVVLHINVFMHLIKINSYWSMWNTITFSIFLIISILTIVILIKNYLKFSLYK